MMNANSRLWPFDRIQFEVFLAEETNTEPSLDMVGFAGGPFSRIQATLSFKNSTILAVKSFRAIFMPLA